MDKPIVIKVGGAFIDDARAASALFNDIKLLQASRPVVLVHGGGPLVESLMQALNLQSPKINGLRVTPDAHMPYIGGALAGTANKMLSARAVACGVNTIGLSLVDGGMVTCTAMPEEFGAVGTPKAANPALLNILLEAGYLPVISSIGSDGRGRLLNINADQAATEIAGLLNAELYLLSNVEGVLDENGYRYHHLTASQIAESVAQGVIKDGMQVKVDAALLAAETLNAPVTIGSWAARLNSLINHDTGTQIHPATARMEHKK